MTRLLLVNDDGIGAIGLSRLKAAADTVSDDVWTVAPAAERSGASHAISLTRPIRARKLGEHEFAVDGSPVDCVALALSALLDRPPDLVLSGVNRGPNLAGDVLYSGTCGAAREAALRGIPAAALSVASVPGKDDDWGGVDAYLAPLLAQLTAARVSAFLNVNFPSLPAEAIAGTQVTRTGSYPPDRFIAHPGRDPRDLPYWWLELRYPIGPAAPGTDIAAVHDGFISITPLRADMTDDAWLTGLADVLSGRRGE
jgi:5'-nucleotidase